MNSSPRLAQSSAGTGSLMALAAMVCVQLGLAVSVGLIDTLGPAGVAWLRLCWAAVILVVVGRPWKVAYSRAALGTSALLGVATGGVTIFFMFAVERIPLGTASALEFLGPLSVAIVQGRGAARWWALVAGAGVLGLTEPWLGATDPVGICFALCAAACWAGYVLFTQKAGDAVSGISALAISMPVAGVVATLAVGPSVLGDLDWPILLWGFGLALLLPVIPFSLEMLALRKLTTAAFGTLMCLEPAIAVLIGLTILHQVPRPAAVIGIVLVIAAGIGATRTGQRRTTPDTSTVAATAGDVGEER
ncbi:EamA family transporter [Glutamicibacter sp. BW78]|uniref:EamA family transporter n=1 Tax=Glutamicibacter sp. BW78 TaxID=2024403 RepID=UPI001F52CE1D|nr:EamA family transporter [Glutamicibacter sp. BW78]